MPFTDGCYHQGVWFSPDATQYDVLILPPASPNELRDWQLIDLSLDNWELGIKELGAPWLVDGLHINDYTIGKEFVPVEALSDPEVLVALHTGADPVGYAGLAAYFPGFCHGVSISAIGPIGMPTWHQHPNAPIGHFFAACAGGGHLCTVTNVGPIALDNEEDRRVHFDLVSHEIGHCLTLGHVGDADTEDLDDSVAYPEDDIMSYENDGHHATAMHCPSNLNVRTIEAAFSNLLGQGGSTANQVQNFGDGLYTHMHPDDWMTANCRQSSATFTDTDWPTTFDPTADDVDGEPDPIGEGARIFITSPLDGAQVGANTITFTGSVDRQGLALSADAGGPYQATVDSPATIAATAAGGSGAYSCTWTTTADAEFAAADACITGVTFAELGVHEILLQVLDGDSIAQGSTNVTVTGPPPGASLFFGSDYARYGTDSVNCGQTYRYSAFSGLPAAGKAYAATSFAALSCAFEFAGTTDVEIPAGGTVLADLYWACDSPAPMTVSAAVPDGPATRRMFVNLTDGQGNTLGTGDFVEPDPGTVICDENVRHTPISITVGPGLAAGSTLVAKIAAFVLTGDAEEQWIDKNLHFLTGGDQPSALYLDGVIPEPANGAPLSASPKPLPQYLGDARPQHIYGVEEAVAIGTSQASPDGPIVPDFKNADGIGPGSGLVIGTQLCTAAWIFQHAETGRFYLSTAGHCLMVDSDIGQPIDGSSPNAANAIDICFLDCATNWAAGLDTFLGLRGSYLHLEQSGDYDPVAFAQAQGVGLDFGLIEIPAEAEPLLRWWLPQWGGPTGVETGGLGFESTAVHFGHGVYCCPQVGGVLTRTPVDQGRVAQFNFKDTQHFEAVAGWASGGDSGSPVGRADLQRVAEKGVPGDTAVGVLTHGLLPVHSGFFGTLVSQGLSMASAFDEGLDGLTLVTEDGPGEVGEEVEPSDDGGVVLGELGALVVGDDGSNLILSLDLDGLLDGAAPQVQASPIEVSVDLFVSHNWPASLPYQAVYSYELYEEDEFGLPTGVFLVDKFGLNILTDVGSDGLASVCPISTDLSASQFDVENNRATWVLPFSAFTHNNYPTRDDGCAAFTTTGDALGPGHTVTDIVARAAPKAVVLSGLPPIDETPPQDYTIFSDNLAPVANAGPNTAVDEGDVVDLTGSCSDADGNLATCAWAQVSGPSVVLLDVGDGAASFTAPEVESNEVVVLALTATDTEGASDTDQVAVTIRAVSSGAEHIELWIDGELTVAGVPVGPTDETPTAIWEAVVDLGPFVNQEILVEARWFDADLNELATDSVTLLVATEVPVAIISANSQALRGSDVVFDGSQSADPDGTITAYAWDFGDGATGQGPQATHRYASLGARTVVLTITDDDGATASDTHIIEILNAPPTAAIAAPGTAAQGADVAMDGLASADPDGSIVSWAWDFGDGGVGAGVQVSHVFGAQGTFTVTLTVTDDDGAIDASTQEVIVGNANPEARIAAPDSAPKSSVITFDGSASSDSGGQISSYAWNLGDGTTATGPVVDHVFNAAGSYTITLTVTDADGGTASATKPILVTNSPPIASFTGPDVVKKNKAATFDASESRDDDGDPLTFYWDWGDGTTGSGMVASHKYKNTGTYTITLYVYDGDGATGQATMEIVVDNAGGSSTSSSSPSTSGSASSLNVDGPALLKKKDAATFQAIGDGALVRWDFGDGKFGVGNGAVHRYVRSGSFTVTAIGFGTDGGLLLGTRVVTVA